MGLRKYDRWSHRPLATHDTHPSGMTVSITRISLACHSYYSPLDGRGHVELSLEDIVELGNVQCYLQQNDVCDAMERKEREKSQ